MTLIMVGGCVRRSYMIPRMHIDLDVLSLSISSRKVHDVGKELNPSTSSIPSQTYYMGFTNRTVCK